MNNLLSVIIIGGALIGAGFLGLGSLMVFDLLFAALGGILVGLGIADLVSSKTRSGQP